MNPLYLNNLMAGVSMSPLTIGHIAAHYTSLLIVAIPAGKIGVVETLEELLFLLLMLGGWKAHTWHCVYIGAEFACWIFILSKRIIYSHLDDLIHKQAILLSAYSCPSIKTSIKINIKKEKRSSDSYPPPTFTYLTLPTPQLQPPFPPLPHRPPP